VCFGVLGGGGGREGGGETLKSVKNTFHWDIFSYIVPPEKASNRGLKVCMNNTCAELFP